MSEEKETDNVITWPRPSAAGAAAAGPPENMDDVVANLLAFCTRLDQSLTCAVEVIGNLDMRVRRLEKEVVDMQKRKPTILDAQGRKAN
jgi:hypothetical protein